MGKILVSGLVNVETNLQVDSFPIEYTPSRYPFFGVKSSVSGVGFNIAKGLTTLGDEVNLISFTGVDLLGDVIERTLQKEGISTRFLVRELEQSPQSVILYDRTGKRQINTDLKDLQQKQISEELFMEAIQDAEIAMMTNINFSRKYLPVAKKLGKWIATDVHTIKDLGDDYNRDFMQAADILFMSHECLPCEPESWASQVIDKYGPEIVVIGMGTSGSLLAVKSDNFMERIPVYYTRPVVNTVGAGDSFFSSFVHFYNQNHDPYEAIQKASLFASYKVGAQTASEGFLSETQLNDWYCKEIHHAGR